MQRFLNVEDPRTGQPARVYDVEGYWREKTAAMTCEHERAELRVWTLKNGSSAVVDQCQSCGDRRGNPVKVTNRDRIPPADMALIQAHETELKARMADIIVRYIAAADDKDSAWWERYNAYLQTPQWQRRRALVLKRCGRVCEGCGEAEATEVHHVSYEHVCEEFLFELKGLCHECHTRWHAGEPPEMDGGEGDESR